MEKEKIVNKVTNVVIALCLLSLLICVFSSCSVSRDCRGRATIITTDTTYIDHRGVIDFKKGI